MSIFGHRGTFKLVFQSRSQSLNRFCFVKKKNLVLFCHKLYDQNETKIHIDDAIVNENRCLGTFLEGQSS
jgi:hypothetical protein